MAAVLNGTPRSAVSDELGLIENAVPFRTSLVLHSPVVWR